MMIPSFRLLLKVTLPLLLITPLFWWFPLDLKVAGLWYDGDWSAAKQPIWELLYHGIPMFSTLMLIASLVLLIASVWSRRLQRLRPVSTAMLLTLVLGPGLLVNAVFKDHWGRPRPRQVEVLGGDQQYQPPLNPNFGGNGKSFPCGHCSVAFSLYTLALLAPTPAGQAGWAIGATLLGAATGAARMAAGGHFLSDILWSAWFTFLASWLSVRWVLGHRLQLGFGAEMLQRYRWQLAAGGGVVALGLASITLMSTPADSQLQLTWSAQQLPRQIIIDQGSLEISLREGAAGAALNASVKGFGWPGSTLKSRLMGETLSFRQRGLFTEYDAHYQLQLPETLADPLEISIEQGDIHLASGSAGQWSLSRISAGHVLLTPSSATPN